MAVTTEQAISGAMRGVMRSLEAAPPPEPGEELMQQYGDMLHETVNACALAMTAIQTWQQAELHPEVDDETTKLAANAAYLRAMTAAVSGLLAVAHFPLLDLVDAPLPGNDRLDS